MNQAASRGGTVNRLLNQNTNNVSNSPMHPLSTSSPNHHHHHNQHMHQRVSPPQLANKSGPTPSVGGAAAAASALTSAMSTSTSLLANNLSKLPHQHPVNNLFSFINLEHSRSNSKRLNATISQQIPHYQQHHHQQQHQQQQQQQQQQPFFINNVANNSNGQRPGAGNQQFGSPISKASTGYPANSIPSASSSSSSSFGGNANGARITPVANSNVFNSANQLVQQQQQQQHSLQQQQQQHQQSSQMKNSTSTSYLQNNRHQTTYMAP